MTPWTLNALALRPDGAGTSTYIRELVGALPVEVQAQLTAVVQQDVRDDLPEAVARRVLPVCAGLERAARLKALRLPGPFHSLDVDLPLAHRGPAVATIHDLSVFDVAWAWPRARATAERALTRHAARSADLLISDSEFTAERVKSVLGRDSVVIPLAAGSDMRPPPPDAVSASRRHYDLPERFVFFLGTAEPRKGLPLLAESCRDLDVPLVVAGGFLGRLEGLSGDVRRLGFVPRAEIPALYAAATVVAYPSHYEGFGLPPVEAMACGAAVLSSRVASLHTLLPDGAAWCAPGDLDSLRSSLRRLLSDRDERDALARQAQIAAGRLSWAVAAKQTRDVWSSLS